MSLKLQEFGTCLTVLYIFRHVIVLNEKYSIVLLTSLKPTLTSDVLLSRNIPFNEQS